MKEDFTKELNELSPFLSQLKKDDPFKTPPQYFEQLHNRIIDSVKAEAVPPQLETAKTPVISLWSRLKAIRQPRYAIGIAASMALLISCGWYLWLRPQPTQLNTSIESLSSEEIHQYIEENIKDFDEEILLKQNTSVVLDEESSILPDAIQEDIEQYLQDNPDDINIPEAGL